MRVSALGVSRIAAFGLVALLLGIGVFVVRTTIATRDSVADAHETTRASRAYEDARYRLGQLQLATQTHLSQPTPETRQAFDSAVDEMLRALDRVREVGSPADRAAVEKLYAEAAPALEVVKRIFAAIERGQPVTDDLPSVDIADQFLALLEPRALAYEEATDEQLHNLLVSQTQITKATIIVCILGLVGVVALAGATRSFGARAGRQALEAELLRMAALRDSLTGLSNHRAYTEELPRQIARAVRHSEGLALVMLDVDMFKQVNDSLGHARGDAVLRDVAEILRSTIREDDYAFRIGGDEFALILPRTNAAAAFTLIERLFQAARAALPAGPTLSAGISVVAANEPLAGNVDESELRESADAALYEAKRAGRDTAVVFRASSGLADGRQEPHRAA